MNGRHILIIMIFFHMQHIHTHGFPNNTHKALRHQHQDLRHNLSTTITSDVAPDNSWQAKQDSSSKSGSSHRKSYTESSTIINRQICITPSIITITHEFHRGQYQWKNTSNDNPRQPKSLYMAPVAISRKIILLFGR